MIAEPFLRGIAREYAANESWLIDFCFVTPNKRSGVFLKKYLGEEMERSGEKASILPCVTTISDFVSDLSDGVEGSRIELLFMLYNVYAEILTAKMTPDELASGKNLVDFNKFQYWGDILLNDFNDVDRYLVDARQLFKNVEDLKEISANYLTPEQIEVIRRYWNEELVPEPVREFWNHTVHTSTDRPGKRNVAGFVKLWQVMNDIYEEFHRRLRSEGLTYSGLAYRDAVEALSRCDREDLPYRRYIFVGFNVLSTSERKIFSRLQELGIADFYWDYASPAFSRKGNRASRFLKTLVKEYPSRYEVGRSVVEDYPEVNIISLPSTVGQIKSITPILQKLYPDIFADPDASQESLVNTAVVLPDENLSLPLLHSLPRELTNVNVTMGFSLRQTPVATLMKNIISLQLRARKLKYENTFFYEDILSVLSHPLIRNVSSKTCDAIVREINENRLFNVPASFFRREEFGEFINIFDVVGNADDPDAVFGYLERLIDWLISILNVNDDDIADDRDDEFEIVNAGSPVLEYGFLRSYRDAVAQLRRLQDRYLSRDMVFMEDKTVFHLVERIAGGQSVAFEGMPLRGLQIMGVLETRGLDFENVIITSMNERIFPRKHYSRSFIPNALRRGYGMATLEHQESMYAYYFYRLITRASRVYLLYDGRSTGVRSGTASRYINQLKFIFPPEKLHFSSPSYRMSSPTTSGIVVEKTERIMRELDRFRSETNPRNLSASSINEYINCPLQFYLSHVEGYYQEQEMKEYMDESTYGTIIHEVVECMYVDQKGELPELEATPGLLKKFTDERLIGHYLERSIKRNYLKLDPDDPRPLTGDADIFHKIMTRSIRIMFERESELGKFFFVQGENPADVRLRVNDSLTVNLTYRIDRVDRAVDADGNSYIRLIDYKTGSDETGAPAMKNLFNPKNQKRQKAILQLFLYSNAYAQKEGYDGRIQPYIYKFRTMAIEPLKPLVMNRRPIDDYRDWNEEFMDLLSGVLSEMFDPTVPFRANPCDHSCKYCKFKDFCGESNR